MEARSLLPVGHRGVISSLANLLRSEKVGQAYLFTGKEGIGKYLVARWFAAGVLCLSQEERPCLNCASCQRVAKAIHVDLKEISPEKGTISIDTIREAQEWLSLTPLEGTRKALLIDNAHTMNIPAANAFLKTLEEPPPSAVIVLVTANPMWLLPTIRSRCQVVWFSPLSPAETREVLKDRVSQEEIARFERVFQGSPGRLLEMLSSPNREELERAAQLILEGKGTWGEVVGRNLKGKKGWVREKEEVSRFLLLLHGAVRERMLGGDQSERIVSLYERLTLLEEEIFVYNINPQLIVESLVGV